MSGESPSVPSDRAILEDFGRCGDAEGRGAGAGEGEGCGERLVRRDRERTKGLVVWGFGPMVG